MTILLQRACIRVVWTILYNKSDISSKLGTSYAAWQPLSEYEEGSIDLYNTGSRTHDKNFEVHRRHLGTIRPEFFAGVK